MRNTAIDLLEELTNAHGAPGFEDDVRTIFARELGELGELSTDGNGSVFCQRGTGPRVLLTGHMDEVAFRVQNITPDGFIQFVSLGGWWGHTLLAQRVEIRAADGRKVLGVISSKPPHFLPESERKQVLAIEQMFIDVGANSREDVENRLAIDVGAPIVPCSEFTAMDGGQLFLAKAFDNRAGMAGTIQATQQLAEEGHPNCLIACGTVQEEVGVRGATTAARLAKPDVAIVLEGAPADDTPGFNPSLSQGAVGKGAQVRLQDPTAIMNPKLVELVKETARVNNIPHQLTVRSSGGTDARAFSLSGHGVPSVVIATPSRYIHSHNSIIDIDDYLATVALSTALVKALDQSTVDSLTSYL